MRFTSQRPVALLAAALSDMLLSTGPGVRDYLLESQMILEYDWMVYHSGMNREHVDIAIIFHKSFEVKGGRSRALEDDARRRRVGKLGDIAYEWYRLIA